MSDVRMEAARRAVLLLKASQLEFAVKMPDGTVEGTLKIAPEGAKRAGWKKIHNFQKDYHYIETVQALQPGENYVWDLGDNLDKANSFAKVVAAAGCRHIGKDKFISQRKDGKVEILRVE